MHEDCLYIVWNEENNIGIPILDEQHRGLVAAINSLYYFISNNVGELALEPAVSYLQHYMSIHFQTEEALMFEAGYPGLKEHAETHKMLLENAGMVTRRAKEEKKPELILQFLKNWWIRHTRESDSGYTQHLRQYFRINS